MFSLSVSLKFVSAVSRVQCCIQIVGCIFHVALQIGSADRNVLYKYCELCLHFALQFGSADSKIQYSALYGLCIMSFGLH